MKNIRTRKFRIDGVMQLGFIGLRSHEIRALRKVKGFRYCSEMSIWHTDYSEGIIPKLNHIFPGKYYFSEGVQVEQEIENVSSQPRHLLMRVYIDTSSGVLYIRHTYHKDLWRSLRVLEGGEYLSDRRYWRFKDGKYYDHIRKLALTYGFSVKLENTIEADDISDEYVGSRSTRPVVSPKIMQLRADQEQIISKIKLELRLRNRSKRTADSYLDCIRSFLIFFASSDIKSLSNNRIREYLERSIMEKGYSYSTINVHISAIKFLYITIYDRGLDEIDVPRPKLGDHIPEVLSIEEVKRMIDSCRNLKHKLIVSLLYSTGIRRSELIGLKMRSIDIGRRAVRVRGKGDKDRIVYLPAKLIAQLERYLKAYKPVEYLIEGQGGGRYSATSVANVIEKARRNAGIEKRVTPHILRHSYATHLVTSGVSLSHVQKILGHSSIKTTMIYTHIADNDIKNIENPLDKMDI